MKSLTAVIMAGGKGTRLHPHTVDIPKPLVPVGERPILEILISSLRAQNIKEIYLAVNHMSDQIETALGDGSHYGVNLKYCHEDKPLSTIGPLKLIDDLPESFFVINGDTLTDIDYAAMYKSHLRTKPIVTIATHERQDRIDYGVLTTDTDSRIVSFQEKPLMSHLVSMGVYLFSKEVLNYIPDNEPFGFDDLMNTLLEKNEPVQSYTHDRFWLDLGRIEDYEWACQNIDQIKKLFP